MNGADNAGCGEDNFLANVGRRAGRAISTVITTQQPVYITFSQQWLNDFYISTLTALLADGQKKPYNVDLQFRFSSVLLLNI